MPARSRALGAGPLFYFRPEYHDHKFLQHYPRSGEFDAALIAARYLAPHPPGSKSEKQGFGGREIAEALQLSGAPYVIDPDTPVLVAATSDLPTPRLGTMPHAEVLPLPLAPMSFANPSDRIDFAQAAGAAQGGAAALAAPYFQFERANDRWHKLNLELINDVRSLAQGRPLVAFVQAPLKSLLDGEVEDVAESYEDAGAESIFLRISGFDPETVNHAAIAAYRAALDAFADRGVDAIADSVGRWGLVLVATGAAGFSCGARYFQRVPVELTYNIEEMIGVPCRYEVPREWRAIDRDLARQIRASLPACPVTNCEALSDESKKASERQKEHLIHYFTTETRVYARGGSAAARKSLRKHPYGNTNEWLIAV